MHCERAEIAERTNGYERASQHERTRERERANMIERAKKVERAVGGELHQRKRASHYPESAPQEASEPKY